MAALLVFPNRNPTWRLSTAGLTGFIIGAIGASSYGGGPLLGVGAGLALQKWAPPPVQASAAVEGLVDGSAALLGRWLLAPGGLVRPLITGRPYALGYVPIPKRLI